MPRTVTLPKEILPKTPWQRNSTAQSKSAEMDTVPVQRLKNTYGKGMTVSRWVFSYKSVRAGRWK